MEPSKTKVQRFESAEKWILWTVLSYTPLFCDVFLGLFVPHPGGPQTSVMEPGMRKAEKSDSTGKSSLGMGGLRQGSRQSVSLLPTVA